MSEYEFYPRPKFIITDYGNMCNPKEKVVVTGSFTLSLYNDMVKIEGLSNAKDAWWEMYEWIMDEIKKQRQINGGVLERKI